MAEHNVSARQLVAARMALGGWGVFWARPGEDAESEGEPIANAMTEAEALAYVAEQNALHLPRCMFCGKVLTSNDWRTHACNACMAQ